MNILGLFRRQIQVARVSGIPVRIDYRWFLVFALSAWVIAVSFREGTTMTQFVRLGTGAAWVAGFLTTFALFLSIFGHELSHALLARAEGIESDEIVLHPFGGLTRLRREPDNPRAEFRIAIAGPSASFLIGVLALVGFYVSKLARLDALAASTGGQLIGGALVVFGGWFYLRVQDPFMGLWLALVGFFLFDAARSVVRRRGSPRTAGDAMTAPVSVEPDATVAHFVDPVLPLHRQEAGAVARGHTLHGILTLRDLKDLPRERWRQTRVSDVMRPVAPQLFVAPQTPLARAEALLNDNGAGALAVVNGEGRLVGLLLRRRVQ